MQEKVDHYEKKLKANEEAFRAIDTTLTRDKLQLENKLNSIRRTQKIDERRRQLHAICQSLEDYDPISAEEEADSKFSELLTTFIILATRADCHRREPWKSKLEKWESKRKTQNSKYSETEKGETSTNTMARRERWKHLAAPYFNRVIGNLKSSSHCDTFARVLLSETPPALCGGSEDPDWTLLAEKRNTSLLPEDLECAESIQIAFREMLDLKRALQDQSESYVSDYLDDVCALLKLIVNTLKRRNAIKISDLLACALLLVQSRLPYHRGEFVQVDRLINSFTDDANRTLTRHFEAVSDASHPTSLCPKVIHALADSETTLEFELWLATLIKELNEKLKRTDREIDLPPYIDRPFKALLIDVHLAPLLKTIWDALSQLIQYRQTSKNKGGSGLTNIGGGLLKAIQETNERFINVVDIVRSEDNWDPEEADKQIVQMLWSTHKGTILMKVRAFISHIERQCSSLESATDCSVYLTELAAINLFFLKGSPGGLRESQHTILQRFASMAS